MPNANLFYQVNTLDSRATSRLRKLSLLLDMVRRRWVMLGPQVPVVMDRAEDSKLRTRSGLRPHRPRTSTTDSGATKDRRPVVVVPGSWSAACFALSLLIGQNAT